MDQKIVNPDGVVTGGNSPSGEAAGTGHGDADFQQQDGGDDNDDGSEADDFLGHDFDSSSGSFFSDVVTSDGSFVASDLDDSSFGLNIPSTAPTYADGEFEDDKADMIAKLMREHASLVTSSLVGRSSLIQSITWLSRHVPGCVLKMLLKSVQRARHARLNEERQRKKHELPDQKQERSCTEGSDESTKSPNQKGPSARTLARSPSLTIADKVLPITNLHESALLFVDMSGFTKISTTLDVESLSNAINSYFQMIVNEIASHGGDILKFAGDAIFAEWKVSRRKLGHGADYCVMLAANCAASIVANCSDYAVLSKPVGFTPESKRTTLVSKASIQSEESIQTGATSETGVEIEGKPKPSDRLSAMMRRRRSSGSVGDVVTLNVKCGLGVGHIVGIHVGDDTSRREFLILGAPIDQVAKAEGAASLGEVFASPEAAQCLAKSGKIRGDWEASVKEGQPVQIANRREQFFFGGRRASRRESSMSCEAESLLLCLDDLNSAELQWLRKKLSLYVHPVVVNDENQGGAPMRQRSDRQRHLAEAELRNVYTCFITPLIECKLTGDMDKDEKLFRLLNDIMNVTTRELDQVQGHLRQYIMDDKGLVLICTFGLRGSTFPNMIAQRAVPFSLSIHEALEEELGVKNKVGATFGKVYCGVVGGLERHEFAVLGPSVNLSARLMASKNNPGVLVDRNVRLLTSQVFFKPLPPVKAKGYDDPVPIFVPIKSTTDNKWGQAEKNFVGRAKEIKSIMQEAKDMTFHGNVSKMLFISAVSGTGKSTLMVQATECVRAMMKKLTKRGIITRNVSREGDSRVPFSLFRSIFKDILSQVRHEDEESQASKHRTSMTDSDEFSISEHWDALSLKSQSTKSSTMSTDATRFRFICQELNAPPEFIDVVGKKLLGLRERGANSTGANAKPPDLQKIVDFMANAFIRCTKQASLVILALDDVQWMDEMSWKVVQTIFERGRNVLTLCGSRPPSSNPLSVDPNFWSDLQGQLKEDGRYSELSLAPFNEVEVKAMIASSLNFEVNEIDSSFSRNVLASSGGMPHHLSYVLDSIKRNNLSVRLENGMVGMKASIESENKLGFGSVGEILLYRLDALDSSVRTALNLSAVLGTEFELLDAGLVYEEMFNIDDSNRSEAAMTLRAAFDVAVEEGIIEQSYVFGEDNVDEEDMDDDFAQPLQSSLCLKGRKAHPFYTENRRLRFTHDSWKVTILGLMMDERKQQMHENVATLLEKELDTTRDEDDFGSRIRILKHWKLSGNFPKAALSALDVGGELMLLGLNSQAILLFDDALGILINLSDDAIDSETFGGIGASILDAIGAPELEYLIKLNIAKGKSYSTLRKPVEGAAAYQSALDILNDTPCAADDDFDRSVSFPIFSGLFLTLKMGAIEQDEECSYEKDLCKKFVEQARLNGDPVHYGRALAMEAETLGRLGNFEQALEVVERIKTIYDIESQHAAICKAYGSDRVAQSFAHSVNFNSALGRIQAALDVCDFITEEVVPRCNPKNIHNTFCLVYAVIIFLKDNGFPAKARDVFQTRVVDPFQEHFGPGGSTYSRPMFEPILTILELQAEEDVSTEKIEQYTAWALDEESFEKKLASCEIAWAAFSASPKAVLGEICYELAKRQVAVEKRKCLIDKALCLMGQSVKATASVPYSNMFSKKKVSMIEEYREENRLE